MFDIKNTIDGLYEFIDFELNIPVLGEAESNGGMLDLSPAKSKELVSTVE